MILRSAILLAENTCRHSIGRPAILISVPSSSKPDSLAQGYLRRIAQFPTRFVDGETTIRAIELYPMPCNKGWNAISAQARNPLTHIGGGIKGIVWHMFTRRRGTNLLREKARRELG